MLMCQIFTRKCQMKPSSISSRGASSRDDADNSSTSIHGVDDPLRDNRSANDSATEHDPLLEDHRTTDSTQDDDSVTSERAAQFRGNLEAQRQLKLIVPAVSIGVFLTALDQAFIISSYGRIGSDLDALHLTSWISTSYFLSWASFQPLYGKLSDIFGRKTCLLFAYAVSGVGALLCASSQTIGHLIVSRILQGIGGAGVLPVVSIIFSDIVPLKNRGIWQAVINAFYAVGALTGASLGGWLTEVVGWRWTFLGEFPLSFIALAIAARVLKFDPIQRQAWKQKLHRIDALGAITLIIAVSTLLLGMDRGSNKSWRTPSSYVSLLASTLFFAGFIVIERSIAREPFAPGRVVFKPSMFASYCSYFFSFAAWSSAQYYLPLFFQAVRGVESTKTGLLLWPTILATLVGSFAAGAIMKRTGKYRRLAIANYFLLAAGLLCTLLFLGVITVNLVGQLIGTAIAAFGNSVGVSAVLIGLIAEADPSDQAVTTACTYLFRSLGSTMGISLGATVVQSVLRRQLASKLGSSKEAQEIEKHVRQNLEYLKQLDPELQVAVRSAYAAAVQRGYVLMLAMAVMACLCSFFISERRLR